jgi:hypothetical protein
LASRALFQAMNGFAVGATLTSTIVDIVCMPGT